jgi:TPR repeat protein
MLQAWEPTSAGMAGRQGLAAVLLAFCIAVLVATAAVLPAQAGPVSGRRTALVIGNSHYTSFPQLPNAINDADHVRDVLQQANFEVVLGTDLDGKALERTVRDFLRSLNNGDIALFYYSGHAVQVAGQNYILPVDASLASPYDLEAQAYNFSNLLQYMGQSSNLQIAILDACRDNPFKSGFYYVGDKKVDVEGNKGLAATAPGLGTLIVYSTAPDKVAYDGSSGLSPFSKAFADQALTPDVEVREVVTRIRNEVINATSGKQVPWDTSSLTTSFYFVSRQNLLIMPDTTEIHVPMAAARVPLNLPSPIGSGQQPLMVTLTRSPANGTLWLGGSKVAAGMSIPADQLARLTYDHGSGAGNDTIEYEVRTADGRKASTSVDILADAAAPAQKEPVATAEEQAKPAVPETAKPQLIAMAADVGTGFVGVANDWQTPRDVGNGWLRLAKQTAGAQVALDDKVIAPGDLVKEADIPHLSVRPSIADAGESVDIALVPAAPGGQAKKPVDIKIAVSVNDCDRLAAEPLDIQAVTEGVLPNEIDVAAALKACQKAVADHPDVGRFKYQYGRALYASGRFDEAIDNLRKAYDQGHVRAGELLGRIYQLGINGTRDPAKAVPLFEAGARKGDPYAQYSLAKALIYGNGTKPDVERGMKLLVGAAESGHTYAMNQLGYEYRYGTHTKADPKRALAFFEKSVARQDVWGMYNLGLLYRDGVGVDKDPDRAMQLFRDADKGGQPNAATLIALLMQEQGKGTPAELLALYRRSAERGDAWGAYDAALLISAKPSLADGPDEAIHLYALAAAQQTTNVSDRAMAALRKANNAAVGRQVQQILNRMGQDVGAVDGVLRPKTRKAASAALGYEAPKDLRKLLVELTRKEWISSRPRLDML